MAANASIPGPFVGLMRSIANGWATLARWMRVIWVARVSTASVLMGWLFMQVAPQARDVFADTSVAWPSWAVFFLVLFFGWAVPVHFAARLALAWQYWAIPRDAESQTLSPGERNRLQRLYHTPVKWVPRILGALCFGAILWGLHRAAANLEPSQGLPQARADLVRMDNLSLATTALLALFCIFIVYRRDLLKWLGVKGRSGSSDYAHNPHPTQVDNYGRLEWQTLLWFIDLFTKSGIHERYRDKRNTSISKEDLLFEILTLATIAVMFTLTISVLFWPLKFSDHLSLATFLVFMLGAWVFTLTSSPLGLIRRRRHSSSFWFSLLHFSRGSRVESTTYVISTRLSTRSSGSFASTKPSTIGDDSTAWTADARGRSSWPARAVRAGLPFSRQASSGSCWTGRMRASPTRISATGFSQSPPYPALPSGPSSTARRSKRSRPGR